MYAYAWLSRWQSDKESACNAGDLHWVRKIPWRREWQPTLSILAWRIRWTEKPDWLQSIGLQRAGQD